jgi:CHAT domain-containing protein
VLHFSCRGGAGFFQPPNSGLLVAEDQVLTLRELPGLRLDQARLAILSACETGVPGTQLLDEVVSLPTDFIQADVPVVVGSL